jgi:flagellar basal-body rod protein FlgB
LTSKAHANAAQCRWPRAHAIRAAAAGKRQELAALSPGQGQEHAARRLIHRKITAWPLPLSLARELLFVPCTSGKDDTMFNSIFGIHEQALLLRGERVGVLASNLANADTPNYKSRDFDFDAAMRGEDSPPLTLKATQPAHLSLANPSGVGADLKYRNPYQATLDGNTVEMPVEQAAFAENSVRYQASLAFINQTIADLNFAITGQ